MADKKPEPTKKPSLGLDLSSLKITAGKAIAPVKKHHALILFILLMSTLIYSVYSVSTIIQANDDTGYRIQAESKSVKTSFDQATIEKVESLRESNADDPIELPAGRRNPFAN